MTTFKIVVEDEKAGQMEQLLHGITFVKSIEKEGDPIINELREPEVRYERLKEIIESAKGKNLFADIEDPSEWQRQIRKEWDRDF
ncbi:MAG TPA: hypothetical protein VJ844_02660 [Mucilaginibacter sp.]|nr:hypothetical protein [Mucilaginibacter sp.]